MLTRYGVTSAFDTGSVWENTRGLRDRIESGEVQGPRIRSTGELLMPKGGSPTPDMLNLMGAMKIHTPEITEVSDAVAASKKLLDAGTNGIKLYAATWYPPFVTLPENAMAAASDEAHRSGRLVFVHPTNRAGLLAALKGGADILVHTTPESKAWDETILSAMKQRGVALIPTLKLWRYELRHDRASARENFVGAGIEQLRAWVGSGGVVLFGTDVGYMSDYDPSDEYALMADAGMDFRQILASLTTAPAERFGASKELGRIGKGLTADLVVLSRDPSKDIRQLGAVRYTIRGGAMIDRQQ
jgi:imidazolonepropionase-like amidohydrolase